MTLSLYLAPFPHPTGVTAAGHDEHVLSTSHRHWIDVRHAIAAEAGIDLDNLRRYRIGWRRIDLSRHPLAPLLALSPDGNTVPVDLDTAEALYDLAARTTHHNTSRGALYLARQLAAIGQAIADRLMATHPDDTVALYFG